jgi:hypothetical protein
LKQLQEVVGNTLEHVGIGNDFLSITKKAQHLREKNEQMGLHQNNELAHPKKVTRLKRQPTEWEKIFASYSSDKGLNSRIYKELKKLNPQ